MCKWREWRGEHRQPEPLFCWQQWRVVAGAEIDWSLFVKLPSGSG